MKISEMSTNQVADVLSVAAIELEPILSDEKIKALTAGIKAADGETQAEYGMRVAKSILSTVLLFSKDYRDGIYRILAEFLQCKPDEIGKKQVGVIMSQLKDSLNDEVFLSFFPSLRSSVQKRSSDT